MDGAAVVARVRVHPSLPPPAASLTSGAARGEGLWGHPAPGNLADPATISLGLSSVLPGGVREVECCEVPPSRFRPHDVAPHVGIDGFSWKRNAPAASLLSGATRTFVYSDPEIAQEPPGQYSNPLNVAISACGVVYGWSSGEG